MGNEADVDPALRQPRASRGRQVLNKSLFTLLNAVKRCTMHLYTIRGLRQEDPNLAYLVRLPRESDVQAKSRIS